MHSRLRALRTAVVAVGGLALLSGAPSAQTLFGASHLSGGDSRLLTIDKATGATTVIGSIGFDGVSALASLSDGRLVGAAVQGGNNVLIDIDRTTGAGTLIGTIGTAGVGGECVRIGGFAYDALTDTLYGMSDQCGGSFSNDSLQIVDTTTGKGTVVNFGAMGAGYYLGSAWERNSGTLYSCDGSQGLIIVDPIAGTDSLVGGPGTAAAMSIDYSTGAPVAYGTNRTGPDLITIDLATGNETVVAGLENFVDAIVFDGALGLAATPDSVSLSTGGVHILTLTAGATEAFNIYLILGALGPGPTPFPGGPVPLSIDPWLLFTVNNPNLPPYAGNAGVLNSLGVGIAQMTIPAGTDPALAGVVFYHAGITFNPLAPASASFVSGSKTLTLVP